MASEIKAKSYTSGAGPVGGGTDYSAPFDELRDAELAEKESRDSRKSSSRGGGMLGGLGGGRSILGSRSFSR